MKYAITDLLHTILKPIMFAVFKLNYQMVEKSNDLLDEEGPFLLLGHHVTDDDPLMTLSLNKKYVHFIYGDANHDNRFRKTMLSLGKAIPLTKNTSDIRAILGIKNIVKDNRNVGIYPEGGRNWSGETDRLIPSTAKLIKLLKIPVYITFYKGGHLTKPRWANNKRKGIIEVSTTHFLRKDEIKALSTDELQNRLISALSYNEFHWQREKMIPFKGSELAEDIERLLYVCPSCHSIDSFNSKGNDFWCESCHEQHQINMYGFIENCKHFDNTVDWNHWQMGLLPKITSSFSRNNTGIILSQYTKDEQVTNMVSANMELNKNQLVLEYEQKKEIIPIHAIKGLSLTLENLCDFHYDGIKYRIRLDSKRHISIKLLYDYIYYIQKGEKNNDK